MNRIAILDLGTNTFNILITEKNKDVYTQLYRNKYAVRLGKGGIQDSFITSEAEQRAMDCLTDFHAIIKQYNATTVKAFATSAVRSAKNGKEFVSRIYDQFHLDVDVISGDREASLIWMGVQQAVDMKSIPSLIIDIGGGSIEFVIGNKDRIFWKKSFDLGASRLLQRFSPENPILKETQIAIEQHLDRELEELWENAQIYKPEILIGSSGSFDTLADLVLNRFHQIEGVNNATSYEYNMEEYKQIANDILASTADQRRQMKGMIEMRVDMMVIATIIVNFILEKLHIKKMTLSTYSLKEGVLKTLSKP